MKAFSVSSVSATALRALNYSPVADRLRRSNLPTLRLGDCVDGLGDSLSRVARVECSPGHGLRLLGQTDTYALEPQGKWVRGDAVSDLSKLRIVPGDLLLAGAGQVGPTTLFGRPVLADARLAGAILGGDTLVLRGKNDWLTATLFALFLSPTGRDLIVSTAYGTSIPRIHLGLVGELPIPEIDGVARARIIELAATAVLSRERYARLIESARSKILEKPAMRDALDSCEERKMRVGVWRRGLDATLGAWNYVSAGDALQILGDAWQSRLRDWLKPGGWYYGLLRQRTPCDQTHGIPLVTQRDVLSIRPLPTWIADPGVPRHALFSAPGTIVMAGRGTLGENELFARPAAITPWLSKHALTQDLVRLVPREEFRGPAFAYLSTLVGRRLLRAGAVGTKILQLRKDLHLNLPVPDLGVDEVRSINADYDDAVAAFDLALAAEDTLTSIIEQEVLPQWLA
jgi:hypothetical protein